MTAPGVSAFCVAVTLGAYLLSRVLARRYPSPLTTPVFCSTALIIAVLTPSGVGVADYEPAKRLMVLLLGPATVSLAVPLYKNRHTLLRNTLPALVGLGVGSLATLGAAVVIARLLGLPEVIRASISIKSVTTPIAVELAPIVHGNPTLTAAFVIARWLSRAPFGAPVVPDVNTMRATSSGSTDGSSADPPSTAAPAATTSSSVRTVRNSGRSARTCASTSVRSRSRHSSTITSAAAPERPSTCATSADRSAGFTSTSSRPASAAPYESTSASGDVGAQSASRSRGATSCASTDAVPHAHS